MWSKALEKRLIKMCTSVSYSFAANWVCSKYIHWWRVKLISDILHIYDRQNVDGYLVTADIEKAFDSVDQAFFSALRNYLDFLETIIYNILY